MGTCSRGGGGGAGLVGTSTKNQYNKQLYETVKNVRGLDIYRMIGTRQAYYVTPKRGVEVNFKTVKAATKFIESIPNNANFNRAWVVDGTGVFRYK